MDLHCLGVFVITDMGDEDNIDEDNIDEVNHDEVLQAAKKAEPHVRLLIREFISEL